MKPWYASKTIWGAVAMLIVMCLKSVGVATDADQDLITDLLVDIAGGAGFVITIVGRFQAKEKIKGNGPPN